MGYDALIGTLITYESSEIIIEWENGLKISGKLDTVFETDNGLKDEDTAFKEFDAAVFRVNAILSPPPPEESSIYNWLIEKKGSLVEISLYENPPSALYLNNGDIIWETKEKD